MELSEIYEFHILETAVQIFTNIIYFTSSVQILLTEDRRLWVIKLFHSQFKDH